MSGAVGDLGGIGDRRVRVAAVADADSFVKWAGALLDTLPDPDARLALVRTPLLASLEQERTALAGTTIGPERVSRVDYGQLAEWIGDRSPDVVVVAGRGPFVRLVMRQIDRVHPRPVVVMGFPGISIPAQRGALLYRREADLLLVHSRRELRAFTELGERLDVPVRLAVARLPYAVPPGETARRGTDLVFAAQAIIPRQHAERVQIADILRRAALADPTRRVVVKLRSRPELGESETHFGRAGYPELIGEAPPNLVFSHAPMSAALAEAEGLVTVSSTAAIEAMAMGVPVIALDTFGVTKTNLNTVFTGSGVLGGADDVIARRFRHPDPAWMPDNYFHDERDVTWQAELEELVARRREGQLAAHVVPAPRGGPLHLAWHRKSVLGAEDRTVSGAVALALGSPVVRAILATRRWRGRRGDHTWSDDTSDITVTPARYQDPIRRPARGARVAG